jgi:hypothetical protein
MGAKDCLCLCSYVLRLCFRIITTINCSPMSERTSRRRIGHGRQIGEPSEDDNPTRRLGRDTTSSASLSTRTLPDKHVLSLTTYCARAFTVHFRRLATREETWPRTKSWLERLPDQMMPTLLVMLSDTCPELLTHGVIAQVCSIGCSATDHLTNHSVAFSAGLQHHVDERTSWSH